MLRTRFVFRRLLPAIAPREHRGNLRTLVWSAPPTTFRTAARRLSRFFRKRRGAAAFSLVEVLVASVVFLLLSLSLALTLLYADRASSLSALQLSAAHALQGQIERLRSDRYENVTPERYPDIGPDSPQPLWLDAEKRVAATVQFDFLTTFAVASATGNSITVDTSSIPTSALRPDGRFRPDELAGNIVLIQSGRGSTQRGYITGNTDDTIHLTADESGRTQHSLEIIPDQTSIIQFNMGKVVTVRLSWNQQGHHFSEEMRTLVILPLEL